MSTARPRSLIAAADPTGCTGGAAGSGGELRLLEGLHHLIQDDAGPLEVCLAEFGSQCIGPRCLRRLDRAQGGVSRWREPQQLGAAMAGIGLVDGQAVADQEVGQALHALPGQVQSAGNLRHRGGFVLDRFQDQPARQVGVDLASSAGSRLTSSGSSTSHKVRPDCGSVARSTAHLQDLEVTTVSFNHNPARGHRAFAQLTGYFSRDLLRGT